MERARGQINHGPMVDLAPSRGAQGPQGAPKGPQGPLGSPRGPLGPWDPWAASHGRHVGPLGPWAPWAAYGRVPLGPRGPLGSRGSPPWVPPVGPPWDPRGSPVGPPWVPVGPRAPCQRPRPFCVFGPNPTYGPFPEANLLFPQAATADSPGSHTESHGAIYNALINPNP